MGLPISFVRTPRKTTFHVLIRWLILLIIGPMGSGCFSRLNSAYPIKFSPDGTTLAYLWQETWLMASPPESAPISESCRLYWCSTETPQKKRSIKLYSIRLNFDYEYGYRGDIIFSPDSRLLAYVCTKFYTIVDLETKKTIQKFQTKETITGLAWLNREEIVFSTHDGQNHQFWRLPVRRNIKQRTSLFEIRNFEYFVSDRDFPSVYWSPRGNFAVFDTSDQVYLLEVKTKSVRTFGRKSSGLGSVAWKSDESAFLSIITWLETKEVLLVNPYTLKLTELTDFFKEHLGEVPSEYYLERFWTPDGRYIIIHNTEKNGGYLVQPKPWRAIPVGKILHEKGLVEWPADIKWQLAPGWILARAGGKEFAVDYNVKNVIQLDEANGYGWVFSPDGTRIANVDIHNKIILRNIDLKNQKEDISN